MNNAKHPTCSVIIPIYNVDAFLRECLDSVFKQTLTDIEIICVNDGSTDNSPLILEEYKQKDPRIFLIHQENWGLSAARNCGMQCAQGKYIYFLDSDDYIESETLERTVQVAEKNDLDAVIFGFERFSFSAELLEKYPYSINTTNDITRIYTGIEYLKAAKDTGSYSVMVWNVLWRRGLLEENFIRFREGILCEDQLFSFQAYMAAKRISRISDILYHYRLRPNSITTKSISVDNMKGFFACALGVLKYAIEQDCDSSKDHEVWSSYRELCDYTYCLYSTLKTDGQEIAASSCETENELFRQIISSYLVDHLRDEIGILHEEDKKLRKEITAEQNEIERLLKALGNQQKVVDSLWKEIGNIHASWTYRIGRAVTWLPRKAREMIRAKEFRS